MLNFPLKFNSSPSFEGKKNSKPKRPSYSLMLVDSADSTAVDSFEKAQSYINDSNVYTKRADDILKYSGSLFRHAVDLVYWGKSRFKTLSPKEGMLTHKSDKNADAYIVKYDKDKRAPEYIYDTYHNIALVVDSFTMTNSIKTKYKSNDFTLYISPKLSDDGSEFTSKSRIKFQDGFISSVHKNFHQNFADKTFDAESQTLFSPEGSPVIHFESPKGSTVNNSASLLISSYDSKTRYLNSAGTVIPYYYTKPSSSLRVDFSNYYADFMLKHYINNRELLASFNKSTT